MEEQAPLVGGPAVEPEGVLIEVGVQMVGADGALVGAQQPAFEQGVGAVNAGHGDVGGVAGGREDGDAVGVAVGGQVAVAGPAVGVHHSAGLDVAFDEAGQGGGVHIGEPQTHPPVAFRVMDLPGDGHDGLGVGVAAVNAGFFAADVGFIDLHGAGQLVPVGADHGEAQFVQHCPGGLVAGQAQDPLECRRGGVELLLVGHVPGLAVPGSQGRAGLVEDRADGHGRSPLTGSADPAGGSSLPGPAVPAGRGNEGLRPARPGQVVAAHLFVAEPLKERVAGARVVDSGVGMLALTDRQEMLVLRHLSGPPVGEFRDFSFFLHRVAVVRVSSEGGPTAFL